MIDINTLGQFIRQHRTEKAYMNVEDFSAKCHIDASTLRKIEQDERAPREAVLKIAVYANLDLSEYGYNNIENAKRIGERIELYRIRNGMSRTQLEKVSHISTETLRYLEKGKYPPTKDKLRLIAEGLNIHPTCIDESFKISDWTILDYIHYYRRFRGYTITELSEKTGFSKHKLTLLSNPNAKLTPNEINILANVLQSDEFKQLMDVKFTTCPNKDVAYYRNLTGLTNQYLIDTYHLKNREIRQYDKGEKEPSLYYISVICDLNHISIKSYITEITLSQIVKYYRDKNQLLKKELVKLLGTYPRALTEVESGNTIGKKAYDSFYNKMNVLLRKDYEQSPSDSVYRFWFEQENKAG